MANSYNSVTPLSDTYSSVGDSVDDGSGLSSDKVIGGYKSLYTSVMEELENLGSQQAGDISERFDSSEADMNQRLDSAGLLTSTITPSVEAGYDREESDALSTLNDTLARQKVDYATDIILQKEAQEYREEQAEEAAESSDMSSLIDVLASLFSSLV